MSDYLFGLFTIPAVALLGYLTTIAYRLVRDWWVTWRPEVLQSRPEARVFAATGMVAARRFFVVRLPLGWLFAYRCDVPNGWSDTYLEVHSALSNAAHRAQKEDA